MDHLVVFKDGDGGSGSVSGEILADPTMISFVCKFQETLLSGERLVLEAGGTLVGIPVISSGRS